MKTQTSSVSSPVIYCCVFLCFVFATQLSAASYSPGIGPPLTNVIGTVITVSNTPGLNTAISTANAGGSVTILLADNTYDLTIRRR